MFSGKWMNTTTIQLFKENLQGRRLHIFVLFLSWSIHFLHHTNDLYSDVDNTQTHILVQVLSRDCCLVCQPANVKQVVLSFSSTHFHFDYKRFPNLLPYQLQYELGTVIALLKITEIYTYYNMNVCSIYHNHIYNEVLICNLVK